MVPPRLRSTRPAPAEITIAMAAITAKAANRLPLTPQRGRKKPKTLPRPNAMPAPAIPRENSGRSIAVRG